MQYFDPFTYVKLYIDVKTHIETNKNCKSSHKE